MVPPTPRIQPSTCATERSAAVSPGSSGDAEGVVLIAGLVLAGEAARPQRRADLGDGGLDRPVLRKPFSAEELAAALSRLIKADYST
jgi:hypothetical protein